MYNKKIEVTFLLFIGSDLELNEQEINANIDIYRSKLLLLYTYSGAIIVNYPDQPIVQIEDSLEALVQNLCFVPIPSLINSKNIVIRLTDHYGDVKLNHESSNIIISGSDIPTIKVPSSELLPALYECGQRIVQFIVNLRGGIEHCGSEKMIRSLENKSEIARKALENMKK